MKKHLVIGAALLALSATANAQWSRDRDTGRRDSEPARVERSESRSSSRGDDDGNTRGGRSENRRESGGNRGQRSGPAVERAPTASREVESRPNRGYTPPAQSAGYANDRGGNRGNGGNRGGSGRGDWNGNDRGGGRGDWDGRGGRGGRDGYDRGGRGGNDRGQWNGRRGGDWDGRGRDYRNRYDWHDGRWYSRHGHQYGGYRGWRNGWNHQRWRAPYAYVYPRGHRATRWTIGLYLPTVFYSGYYANRYYIDWQDYGLEPPPWGCEWVRVGSDLLLVEVGSGYIVDVLYGFFY